MKSPRSC